jgi:hypothetical protein
MTDQCRIVLVREGKEYEFDTMEKLIKNVDERHENP